MVSAQAVRMANTNPRSGQRCVLIVHVGNILTGQQSRVHIFHVRSLAVLLVVDMVNIVDV